MITLLICSEEPDVGADALTRFGGKPVAPQGQLAWPVCKSCRGPMQFLGQLRQDAEHRIVLLFMCQNDPGLCDEWEADGGGNRVVVVSAEHGALVEPPPDGLTLRQARYGAISAVVDAAGYDEARGAWAASHGVSPRQVLGQLAGSPSWLQADQTPACDRCRAPMRFLAQLEEGPDHRTAMNFGGGGCAYLFQCADHSEQARMLWQS